MLQDCHFLQTDYGESERAHQIFELCLVGKRTGTFLSGQKNPLAVLPLFRQWQKRIPQQADIIRRHKATVGLNSRKSIIGDEDPTPRWQTDALSHTKQVKKSANKRIKLVLTQQDLYVWIPFQNMQKLGQRAQQKVVIADSLEAGIHAIRISKMATLPEQTQKALNPETSDQP